MGYILMRLVFFFYLGSMIVRLEKGGGGGEVCRMGHVGATGRTPRPVASPWCHLVEAEENLISTQAPSSIMMSASQFIFLSASH